MPCNEFDRMILRGMAWERAKGELRSILISFVTDHPGKESNYSKCKKCVEGFIKKMEDEEYWA